MNNKTWAPLSTRCLPLITATKFVMGFQMAQEYINKAYVYPILKYHDGYRLIIAPEYSEWVRALLKEPKPLRLNQSLLETLAIIAYSQPVTRAEMDAIRGVAVDNAINKLLELELNKGEEQSLSCKDVGLAEESLGDDEESDIPEN